MVSLTRAQPPYWDHSPPLQVVCRNEECAASGLMHARCFEKFEEQACKALAKTPRGSRWTEGQVQYNFFVDFDCF